MSTRRLRLGAEFVHEAAGPTHAVFLLQPKDDERVSKQSWHLAPDLPTHAYRDMFGNHCHRIQLPAGESLVAWYATAEIPDEVDARDPDVPQLAPEDIPDDLLVYTMPSRYCQSDMLSNDAWNAFGGLEPNLARVEAICAFVWERLDYRTGSTMSWWTAVDAFNERYGVCRDFAHVMVALCRALNIPARYVTGLLPDMDVTPNPAPMDFHAWVEVYLGDRWWSFDPRHNQRRKGRIAFARGRDAADVALVTTYGAPWLKRMTIFCEELVGDLAGITWPPAEPPASTG